MRSDGVHHTHRFCVAPMMDWTDRHCRYFLRLLSRHARLYTEMVTAAALNHGDVKRLLRFNEAEHPLALQIGGSNPGELARAARLGADAGYDEINLNIGCPSDRVQSGRFGACLMAEPELVADGVAAMRAAVGVPVTVKTRVGIDDHDSYDFLHTFIATVAGAGCDTFIVHARKAWLTGLSPKQNREVPPLQYERVHRLKRDFPDLSIVINGGLATMHDAERELEYGDGVMFGRAAYQNPYLLAEVDARLFGGTGVPPSREAVIEALIPYLARQREAGVRVASVTRHVLGLFQGAPGARHWRRYLSEHSHRDETTESVLREALAARRAVA